HIVGGLAPRPQQQSLFRRRCDRAEGQDHFFPQSRPMLLQRQPEKVGWGGVDRSRQQPDRVERELCFSPPVHWDKAGWAPYLLCYFGFGLHILQRLDPPVKEFCERRVCEGRS